MTSKYSPSSGRSADRLAEQVPDSPTAAGASTSATPEHSSGGQEATHARSPQRHGSHSHSHHRRTASSSGAGPSSGGAGLSSGGAAGGGAPGQQPGGHIAPKPFAFIVPLVAKSCLLLFDEANRCTKVRGACRLSNNVLTQIVPTKIVQKRPDIGGCHWTARLCAGVPGLHQSPNGKILRQPNRK